MHRRAWFPLVSYFMKQETHAEIRGIGLRGQGNFPRRHYPDRVLGYFLSPTQVEHPCFNNPIETLPARFGKCAGQTGIFMDSPASGQPWPTLNAPTRLVNSLASRESCWHAPTDCRELAAVC